MKAEQFLKDYQSTCSNELTDGGYHPWLTPEQALRAVEIAKEEVLESVVIWLHREAHKYTDMYVDDYHLCEDLIKEIGTLHKVHLSDINKKKKIIW